MGSALFITSQTNRSMTFSSCCRLTALRFRFTLCYSVEHRKMKKHNAYTVERKLAAVETAKKSSKKNAARIHNVDPKRIREWCRDEAKLKAVSNKRSMRLSGGGRQVSMPGLEEDLISWIKSQRHLHIRVSRKMIQRQAKFLYDNMEEKENEFNASEGWLSKFMERNNFGVRRRTTTIQKAPERTKERVINFLLFVNNLRKNCAYSDRVIAAADEVAVWLDPVSETTVEEKGVKSVTLMSAGNSKAKVTVLLAAFADGRKLKPFIVFKGKRLSRDLIDYRDAVISVSRNGWMTEETTLQWIQQVWGTFAFSRRLLVWDSFQCHKTNAVRKKLNAVRTDTATIPGGCTGLLQAPDVCWNRPFKLHYREMYEEWIRTAAINSDNRTHAGNIKAPSKRELCNWVVTSWNAVKTDVIIRSFKTCGLTTNLHGTDDHEIHAVKELNIFQELQERRKQYPTVNIESDVSSGESNESVSEYSDCEL